MHMNADLEPTFVLGGKGVWCTLALRAGVSRSFGRAPSHKKTLCIQGLYLWGE